MYRNFYNFTSMPFEVSPDPKFLWLGEKYEESLAAVRYGTLANAGFLSLTGDVGTGKTTLVNVLANSLGDNIIFAKIPDPYLKTLDFFNFAANAFENEQGLEASNYRQLQNRTLIGRFSESRKKFKYQAQNRTLIESRSGC